MSTRMVEPGSEASSAKGPMFMNNEESAATEFVGRCDDQLVDTNRYMRISLKLSKRREGWRDRAGKDGAKANLLTYGTAVLEVVKLTLRNLVTRKNDH